MRNKDLKLRASKPGDKLVEAISKMVFGELRGEVASECIQKKKVILFS